VKTLMRGRSCEDAHARTLMLWRTTSWHASLERRRRRPCGRERAMGKRHSSDSRNLAGGMADGAVKVRVRAGGLAGAGTQCVQRGFDLTCCEESAFVGRVSGRVLPAASAAERGRTVNGKTGVRACIRARCLQLLECPRGCLRMSED